MKFPCRYLREPCQTSQWTRCVPLLYAELFVHEVRQILRDEDMGMDVDGDPDTTQRPKEVEDYGLELDYSNMEEEDLQVRNLCR